MNDVEITLTGILPEHELAQNRVRVYDNSNRDLAELSTETPQLSVGVPTPALGEPIKTRFRLGSGAWVITANNRIYTFESLRVDLDGPSSEAFELRTIQ